jgi:VCBS repeat-containing protein
VGGRGAHRRTGATRISRRRRLPKGKRATPLARAVKLSLKPRGSTTLTLALTKATQKALHAGRAVTATLTLELRSGAMAKTVKVAIRLKRAAPAKRR